jgi:hypothetical protein
MHISQSSVAHHGLLHEIEASLKHWNPGDLDNEVKYRDSLIDHLRRAAPDATVEPDYRHKHSMADIHFKWRGLSSDSEVFFQLKRHLRRNAECNRLLDEINSVFPGKNTIVVVLCGDIRRFSLQRLRDKYNDLCGADVLNSRTMVIHVYNPHALQMTAAANQSNR